jgi:LCP family protein required for cell wall assembly
VSAFLKKNWKWFALGTGVVVLAVIAFMAFRVISFVSDVTGGGRPTEVAFSSPTPDIPATATNQAKANALFGTPTPGSTTAASVNAAISPTPTTVETNFNTADIVQKIKGGQPITLMLMGYGGNGHEGEWLTDSILIMRYDPKTKTMQQFSMPRDLYLFVPYGGKDKGAWMKVNSILGFIMQWSKPNQDALDPKYRWSDDKKKFSSGVNLAADTIQGVLGIRIDYWTTMSFEGFRKFIDAMGGVEVDVERDFVDKKYPKNDNDQIDASYVTIEFKAGLQRMDGETAIRYARSRYSESVEGGDFARSRRQMRLITAVKDKALKDNLVLKSLDYMGALQGNIRFSLDFGELTALANYLNSPEGKTLSNDVKFSSEVLTNEYVTDTSYPDVGYALIPIEGKGDYTQIQRWVQRVTAAADIRRENIRVQVLNANGKSGIAGDFEDYLLSQGFRTTPSVDSDNRDFTEIVDYTNGQSPNTVAKLKSYLSNLSGLKITKTTADKRPPNLSTDTGIQLFLGKDFKGATNASSAPTTGGQGPAPSPKAQIDNSATTARREDLVVGSAS